MTPPTSGESRVELLPCPFCGRDKATHARDEDMGYEEIGAIKNGHWIVCDFRKNGCGNSTGWHISKESAIAAWNRRSAAPSQEAAPVAWIRYCSDGGYEGPIHDGDARMCDVRKSSGNWTPLYAHPPAASEDAGMRSIEPMVLRDLRDGMSLHDNPNLTRKDGEQVIAHVDWLLSLLSTERTARQSAVREAVAQERERCIAACETVDGGWGNAKNDCIKAIRAQTDAEGSYIHEKG